MRRALGKGLSQLLAESEQADPTSIPIADISTNSHQPRTKFNDESLEELADSIRQHGVISPLIVRPSAEGYELIAGERRLRASQLAGLKEVPVIVRTVSAQESLEIALIENIQREDITAIECAFAYKSLADEFGLSQEQIASRVGKSRAAITNTLRLLKLPAVIQDALREGLLTEGHARALLSVESAIKQEALFERILAEGLSVRETERLSKFADIQRAGSQPGKPKDKDPNTLQLERGLSEYFGSEVTLKQEKQGGKIAIDYYSDEDLQRILDILGISL